MGPIAMERIPCEPNNHGADPLHNHVPEIQADTMKRDRDCLVIVDAACSAFIGRRVLAYHIRM